MDIAYLKRTFLRVGILLLLVFFLLYTVYHVFGSHFAAVSTQTLRKIQAEKKVSACMTVFRTEQVVHCSSAAVAYGCASGERVAKDEPLAYGFAEEQAQQAKYLQNLQDQLAFFEQVLRASTPSVRFTQIQAQITEAICRRNRAIAKGEAVEISCADELLRIAALQLQEANGNVDLVAQEKQLLSDRAQILAAAEQVVTATASGWFYAVADGYSQIYSVERLLQTLQTNSPEEMQALLTASPATFSSDVIGTLVTEPLWYGVCLLPTAESTALERGNTYEIAPQSGGNVMQCTLIAMLAADNGTYGVFTCETLPVDCQNFRFFGVDVFLSSQSGYEISYAACRFYDGKMGIFLLYGDEVRFVAAEILKDENGAYLLAASDELYEGARVITEGRNLYDGKRLGLRS